MERFVFAPAVRGRGKNPLTSHAESLLRALPRPPNSAQRYIASVNRGNNGFEDNAEVSASLSSLPSSKEGVVCLAKGSGIAPQSFIIRKKLTAIFYYEAIASNKARPSVTIKKMRYVKLSKHNGLTAIFYNTDLSPLKIYAIITSRDTRHTKNQRFLVFRRTLKYPFGLHPAAQGHSPAFSRAIVLSSSDSIGEQGQQRF